MAKNDVKLWAQEWMVCFPVQVVHSCASPPCPQHAHHGEFFQHSTLVQSPFLPSEVISQQKKKPKNLSFTMDSSTQLRGGEERLKNHKIKQDKALQKCKIMSPASVLSLNYVSVTLSQGQSRKKKLLDSPCRRGFITLLALDNLITSKVV